MMIDALASAKGLGGGMGVHISRTVRALSCAVGSLPTTAARLSRLSERQSKVRTSAADDSSVRRPSAATDAPTARRPLHGQLLGLLELSSEQAKPIWQEYHAPDDASQSQGEAPDPREDDEPAPRNMRTSHL